MKENIFRFWIGRIKLWTYRAPKHLAAWLFLLATLTLAGHVTAIVLNLIFGGELIPSFNFSIAGNEWSANALALAGGGIAILCILVLNIRLHRILLIPIWLLNLPVFLVSCVLPKKPNRWLFAARQGTAFAENPKHLFNYVSQHEPDIEAIWVTRNREVCRSLRDRGLRACMSYSPRGYWYSMTAGVLFLSHNRIWVPDANGFAIGRGTLILQLWHGSPIKRLGHTVEWDQFSRLSRMIGRVLMALFPFLAVRSGCHRMLAACPTVASHLADSYNLDQAHMLIGGYPKNDGWLQRIADGPADTMRRVIFMPTFRSADWRLFVDYEFDLQRLDTLCRDNGIEFHVKLHPYSLLRMGPLMEGLKTATNVFHCDCEDIYDILDQFDILVTDYSSISFDYLLCDRPIIYAPFDYESYRDQERGFLEDYTTLTPGPMAQNWRELEAFLLEPLDAYSEARQQLSARYNSYQGDDSCGKLVRATNLLLKEKVADEAPVSHGQY